MLLGLFGYHIEADFDLSKEQRRDRVGWTLVGGSILIFVYFFTRHLPVEIFQGYFATVLCYGSSFYVNRGNQLGKLWLWKAFFATVPLHVLYLAAVFWSDKTFPNVMIKGIVFIPLLSVGFAIESTLFDRIADHFKPATADHAGPVAAP